jgi:thiamine-monophosphate kinase
LLAVDEDSIVADIAAACAQNHTRLCVPIGDDAAAWRPSRSALSVISSDVLVEGVHFEHEWMSAEDIGWRAMASNLSDIAAMGARPLLATVALGLPPAVPRSRILAYYDGMLACARANGVELCGGDLSRAPAVFLALTVTGEVRPSNLKRRSSARAGDILAVTGRLGASRAGLAALRDRVVLGEHEADALAAFRRPEARVAQGRWFGASRSVHALMDCSDGLASDLARLARASGVGARIEDVPVAASAAAAAAQLGERPEAFALAGGEDFELLVSIAPRAFAHLARRFEQRFGRPLYRLGRLLADERVVVVKDGNEEALERTGWDHFS